MTAVRFDRVRAALMLVLAWSASGPISPYAQTPTADNADSLAADADGDSLADRGDTIQYNVTVSNPTGAASLLLMFMSTVDPNTTFVPGSLNVSPLALDDNYETVGNTLLEVGVAASGNPAVRVAPGQPDDSVLDNDHEFLGDTFTLAAVAGGATTNGGTINLNADGTFTYIPAAGFSGTDTFTYTIRDDGTDGVPGNADDLTGTGVIRINVLTPVWYVSNAATPGGTGRSDSPFDSLADVSGAAGPDLAGDIIYLYAGAGSYTGGITLLDNQTLWGNGVALTVGGHALIPAGGTPVVVNSGGNGVTLASGNTIRGFDIGSTNAGGFSLFGMNFGTLNGSIVNINNASGGGLSLFTGTINNITFGSVTSAGSASQGINLDAVAGTVTFGGGSISGAAGAAFRINGGTVSSTCSGSITQANNAPLVFIGGGHATGSVLFQTGALSATNGTGLQFDNAESTAGYTFSGLVTLNGGDAGIDIINGSAGHFTFNNAPITNPSGTAFAVSGGGGSVGHAGAISKNNAGRLVDIQGRTGGSVTLTGNLSSTGAGATGILCQSNSGGLTTFSGGMKTLNTGAGAAVTLTNNTGATFDFTGGNLDIDTTSGAGFTATGGGTVTVQGAENTINAGTGAGVNVVSTNIGLNGLTFQSVSSNGGVSGIVLNDTGTTAGVHGGLTVTGVDGPDAGTLPDTGTGGTIQNTSGDSMLLSSARSISLGGLIISNSGANNNLNDSSNWIDATSVSGLMLLNVNATESVGHGLNATTLTDLMIQGGSFFGGGLDNNDANFNGFNITNLLGGSSITGALIEDSNTVNFRVNNNSATNFLGAPDVLTVSGTTWLHPNPSGPFSGDHLSVSSDTGGNFRIVVNNSAGTNTFTGGGTAVQAAASGTNGKMDAQLSGILNGGAPLTGANTAMAVVAQTGGGSVTYNINGNTSLGTGSLAIAVTHTGTGTSSGTINGNNVTHVAGPGTNAVQVIVEGNGTGTAVISNNTISGNYQRGIQGQARLGMGILNLTINNNVLTGTDTTNTALQQINLETGGSGTGHANTICLNMHNNTVNLGPGGTYLAAYRLSNRAACTFRLQNFVTGMGCASANGSSTADVGCWVMNTKTNAGAPLAVTATAPFVNSPGNCAIP